MAQTREFTERRDPHSRGRRATDAAGAVLGDVARGASRAMSGALGMAAGAAAALTGRRSDNKIDPAAEEQYWHEQHMNEPYYDAAYSFEDYLPAYRAGWEGRTRFPNRSFEEVERDLEREYSWNRGGSRLLWQDARRAMRAAWDHVSS
jgi:hypothetical protein